MQRLIFVMTAVAMIVSGCTSTSVSTGYYEVSGKTGKELDRSIASNAPMRGHAFAATQLTIRPVSVLTGENASGCRVTTAKFRVDAKITMPRWTNRKGASKNLRDGFDIFADYARLHEQIHVKIGEKAANEMERALLALPPQKTCAQLEQRVKQVINDIQREHHKAQLAFDAAEEKRISRLLAKAAQ